MNCTEVLINKKKLYNIMNAGLHAVTRQTFKNSSMQTIYAKCFLVNSQAAL